MISEERDDQRHSKTLLWALLASVLIHALVLPAVFRQWSENLAQSQRPATREWVVSSTAIRIEKRTVPRPKAQPAPQPQPPQPQPQTQAVPAQAAPPPAPRQELAKSAPTAPPQTKTKSAEASAPSLEQQIAQQQQTFSQEVARLHEQNNPLSIAPKSQAPASTWRRTYFDVPGHQHRNEVEALLIPIRHWMAGSMSCYYVRYVAQFTEGGSEDGVIPWPVCYPVTNDAMANPPYPHDLPIPIPQRDYVLPSGTYLTPLLKSIYDRRS